MLCRDLRGILNVRILNLTKKDTTGLLWMSNIQKIDPQKWKYEEKKCTLANLVKSVVLSNECCWSTRFILNKMEGSLQSASKSSAWRGDQRRQEQRNQVIFHTLLNRASPLFAEKNMRSLKQWRRLLKDSKVVRGSLMMAERVHRQERG